MAFLIINLAALATSSISLSVAEKLSHFKGDTLILPHLQQIDENIGTFAHSAESISESSAQLNALLLPIIASIGLIVALQVTILARRR